MRGFILHYERQSNKLAVCCSVLWLNCCCSTRRKQKKRTHREIGELIKLCVDLCCAGELKVGEIIGLTLFSMWIDCLNKKTNRVEVICCHVSNFMCVFFRTFRHLLANCNKNVVEPFNKSSNFDRCREKPLILFLVVFFFYLW